MRQLRRRKGRWPSPVRPRHVRELACHRDVHLAAPDIPGNRERSERRAVVALRTAEHVVALALAGFDLILARELQRSLHGLGAAAGEVHASAAKMLSRKLQQCGDISYGNGGGELASVHKLQLRRLCRNRLKNCGNAVANKIHHRLSGEIQIALALGIPNVNALASHSPRKRFAKRAGECGGIAGLCQGSLSRPGKRSVKVRDRCYRSVYPAEETRGSGDFAMYNRG